jgi:hypothetical protein
MDKLKQSRPKTIHKKIVAQSEVGEDQLNSRAAVPNAVQKFFDTLP